jgi:hypothetical protein
VDLTWTFSRGAQRLSVERGETPAGVELRVSVDGAEPRVYPFASLDSLVPFQSDMEKFLLQTGWTFVQFSPERRKGRDRRGFPRVENDRRRWWTDGRPDAETDADPIASPKRDRRKTR